LAHYQMALNILPIHFKDSSIFSNPDSKMLKLVANENYASAILTNKAEALLNQYKEERNDLVLKAALQTFKVADAAIDQMRCNQYNETSKLFWRNITKKMYEDAIEVCYLLNDHKNAFCPSKSTEVKPGNY